MVNEKELILSVKDLNITFHTNSGDIHAIRGVNLELYKGQTIAIVGESGSGKSVTARAIMGMLADNASVDSGSIKFKYVAHNGNDKPADILTKSQIWIRKHINGRRVAMVFQDPMTSLDPTMKIGEQIMEGMIWHNTVTPKLPKEELRIRKHDIELKISDPKISAEERARLEEELVQLDMSQREKAYEKAKELLEEVGITDVEKRMKQYPHQLSGGMRQRVVIAIALACDPELLICDEPTTALDVTIQAKILELICDIQKRRGVSIIYITHDLGVVAKVADYVNVMYAGKIVEKGTIDEIFYDPRHPYTWGLLAAMPDLQTDDSRLYTIPGSPPNLLHEVEGDAFAPRNKYALKVDEYADPPMFKITQTHYAATWLLDPRAPKVEMSPELKKRIARMKKEAKYHG